VCFSANFLLKTIMSCMRRFVYRIFFSEVFEQKVRLLADCVAVLVPRPTCLPLLCGHCLLPSPTTDVIIFSTRTEKLQKKKNCTSQNFVFLSSSKSCSEQSTTYPTMSLLLFFITCTTYISIIIIQSLVIIYTKIMEIID